MFWQFTTRGRLLNNPKLLGRWGEKHSLKFLKRKGLKKIARNFRCKTGEIDLVMADKDGTIAFIEVKTRADEDFNQTEDAITPSKKNRLIKSARYFLSKHNVKNRPYRFDVVTIVLNQTGPEEIRHYENAFTP